MCACSHGHLADPSALRAVLDFKRKWKPELCWHLGDFLDLAALRSGAKGTSDESKSILDDFKFGFDFIRALEPQKLFVGNHEDRLLALAQSPSAVISFAASQAFGAIQDEAQKLRAEIVPYDVETGWRPLGDALAGHGYMFSENAIRDHAEMTGKKTVIGHLHTVGQANGRCIGAPAGYCVGTLSSIHAMAYARRRRASLRWSQGFAWGEYNDREAVIYLCEKTKTDGWRFPIV